MCTPIQAAVDSVSPQTPSLLPVTLTLDSGRLQQAVVENLGTEIQRGVAQDKLFDGAVGYKISWSLDPTALRTEIKMSGDAVLLELGASMDLLPAFTLSKGADKIYSGSGCGRTRVSLRFSVLLAAKEGNIVSTQQPAKVGFPRRYSCSYKRNLLGDARNLFTRDTEKQIDVVPLMASGIKAETVYFSSQFNAAVAALAAADSPRQLIQEHLQSPLQISPNLWLSARVLALSVATLNATNGVLKVEGRLTALPRFGFGGNPPQPTDEPSAQLSADERFYLPFDLLIPRDSRAVSSGESIDMGRPQYRFRAVGGMPGVAALQRYQAELQEDVVLLESSDLHPTGERIAMEGAIDAVLEEIIDWLEKNAGVRAATDSRERLLHEVRRAASVVAYFQRPRNLPLSSMGSLTLSELSTNLRWVALELDKIRANVMLTGRASLHVAL